MALSRNEIKLKLEDIMKMVMRDRAQDFSNLDENTNLVTDLGLSSVGILYVVIAIEEFFGIEFENVGFGDFKTIGSVIDYIEEKQQ